MRRRTFFAKMQEAVSGGWVELEPTTADTDTDTDGPPATD
jgi:hypothetical protein